ncbi:MAG TPA: IS630 family transposase [Propionibacteriaceae bacterium]|nr:IS630 family transposase [Propionibacteriaceae bacterium]
MPGPLSQDLRDRLTAAVAAGSSARAAAERFGVSESTAIRWAQRWRAEGEARARPLGGDHRSRLSGHREAVLTLVAHQSDLTLAEIRAELAARHGIRVGQTTIWRFFERHRITVKKSLHATEQGRPDVAAARRRFIVRQPALDPKHLIFLDETSATTKMTRTHGRCLRGQRLLEPVPHGHWKTSTLVAGLCLSGITAPYVMDGAMTGDVFLQYIKQILAPTLTAGDIVVMDNVATHKVAGIREAIEARGATLLYLPPYSPDLNPIEKAFAKIKATLRKIGARTREALWQAIALAIDDFSSTECLNLFKSAGYAT